jgi:hypothetical protein
MTYDLRLANSGVVITVQDVEGSLNCRSRGLVLSRDVVQGLVGTIGYLKAAASDPSATSCSSSSSCDALKDVINNKEKKALAAEPKGNTSRKKAKSRLRRSRLRRCCVRCD